MSLSLDEFLRRFLLHLLPKGFVRIRHFGILSDRRYATLLPLCLRFLGALPPAPTQTSMVQPASSLWRCPQCAGPMVVTVAVITLGTRLVCVVFYKTGIEDEKPQLDGTRFLKR